MTLRSYQEMKRRHLEEGMGEGAFIAELHESIKGDPTGRGIIYEMFLHELTQSEYSMGSNLAQVLEPLGLTAARVHNTPALFNGLKMAMEDYVDDLEAAQEEMLSE
jgi:hypothetical protein